ncbi:acetyl-CoA C-acetyltransferase [Cavenderia fasciculata]|uniref:acetyl-CoA C-acetyltransferase n=1 Tax=Cavenderia fasciculata TaxID=261658 RepID=F4PY28_CACFS|nr:acetyl-CoA C-acetyltransferase [Cavenderia fasciculata]EGG19688.1 acetyl-CoA C-acetyltransferase [Cavenderia fasciculata]|eukprot:XP_004357982.1 acetyl-CoA C-acetyltransferase [Cavenderia fasciculata]
MYLQRINILAEHLKQTDQLNSNNNYLDSNHCSSKTTTASTMNQQQPLKRTAIVSYCRTPMGGFNGSLASFNAVDLASLTIREAISRCTKHCPDFINNIDEVLLGNVMSANLGQAPAKQASLNAGIPPSVPCTAINKVCASGMKAVMFGSQLIQTGACEVVVAGGFESMSNVPYYLPNVRNSGLRMGNGTLVDGMLKDGLTDPFGGFHMGIAAEKCSKDYSITKQQQDEYAITSYRRALEATKNNHFAEEIVPVKIAGIKGKPDTFVTQDDEINNANYEKLGNLQPAFQKDGSGTVTAGNASVISDGASIIILMSEEKAKQLNIPIIAFISGCADAAQEPIQFTTTPAIAIPKALKNANIPIEKVDLFEINEAFSVVALSNMKILNIPHSKINIYGGAVALGHPLGSSGSRIICTLISALKQTNGKIGVASICNGGGGASAVECDDLPINI